MSSLAHWNVKGMNDPLGEKECKDFLCSNKVSLVAFLETKIKRQNSDVVANRIAASWKWFYNYDHAHNGRIWIAWDDRKWDVTVISYAAQYVHLLVRSITDQSSFLYTYIYAYNNAGQREELWDALETMGASITSPWILLGDWNTVLNQEERINDAGPVGSDTRELQRIMSTLSLTNILYNGSYYTWCNNQEGEDRIYSKLDRAVGNSEWISSFPQSWANFISTGSSDHSPCLIKVNDVVWEGQKPFRFCGMWKTNPKYQAIVREAWDVRIYRRPMLILVKKN